MVDTDWNNDLGDDNEERELTDHDFEREPDEEENPNEIKAPSLKELFNFINPKP